jgi:hypothetical protein
MVSGVLPKKCGQALISTITANERQNTKTRPPPRGAGFSTNGVTSALRGDGLELLMACLLIIYSRVIYSAIIKGLLTIHGVFQPHSIDDAEGTGEQDAENPGEIPHTFSPQQEIGINRFTAQ